MKQKMLAVLVTVTMLGTSVTPITAAEFSSGEDVVEQGSGVVSSEDEFSAGVSDYDDDDYDDDYDDSDYDDDADEVQNIKIVKGPDVDTYYYGLEISEAYELGCAGLTAEILYKDGTTDTITFNDREEEVYDKWNDAYRCYIKEDDESFGVGTFHFYIEDEAWGIQSDSCPVYVVSPENLPELNQNVSGSAVTTVQTRNDRVLAKFVPQKTGLCSLSFLDIDGLKMYPNLYDKDMDMADRVGENTYSVTKGESYYIIGYVGDSSTQVTVTYLSEITSMKLVKEPTVKYTYYGAHMQDGFYVRNGEIEITYADGTSEIVSTNGADCKTKYGERFVPYYGKNGEYPSVGKYDMYYRLKSCPDMEVTIKDVEIKAAKDMPTINGSGSKTADTLGTGSTWVCLKTGKNRVYKIESSGNYGLTIFKDYGTGYFREAPGCADLPSNATVVLEPNSEYYITVGPGIHAKEDQLTYKVSAAKYDINKCNIEVKDSYTYTGKAINAGVTIYYGWPGENIKLKAGRDYTITYTNNKNVGTAKIKIKGKGEFTGTATKNFNIKFGKLSLKTVAKSGSSAIKVSWAKLKGATGYEIYRTTSSKWTKVATTKSASYIDKKVKKGTAYRYKIRAYAKVNGKTIYSDYSSAKSVVR